MPLRILFSAILFSPSTATKLSNCYIYSLYIQELLPNNQVFYRITTFFAIPMIQLSPINLKPFTAIFNATPLYPCPFPPSAHTSLLTLTTSRPLSLESCGCQLLTHHLLKRQARTFLPASLAPRKTRVAPLTPPLTPRPARRPTEKLFYQHRAPYINCKPRWGITRPLIKKQRKEYFPSEWCPPPHSPRKYSHEPI